jgi:hypothetical protein
LQNLIKRVLAWTTVGSFASGADCMAEHRSASGFRLVAFAEAHAGSPAVLVDELDAGPIKRPAEHHYATPDATFVRRTPS